MSLAFMIFLAAVAAIVIFAIVSYNRLVSRYFNAVVRDLNTTIEMFPSNLVAGLFQFREHAYFELDRLEERQVPRVSFGA